MNLKTIKDKVLKNEAAKYLLIFIVVFVVITFAGLFCINHLYDTVTDNHVHPMNTVIIDKYDASNGDLFVITEDNKTLLFAKHSDGYEQEKWNELIPGEKYRFIIQEPDDSMANSFPKILQVHNDSKPNN